ncbi:MAG: pentose kinase [Verrucomicrobia bacterium]|nr:pentose kinase [Verrucomicrobiota bacterium]
MTSRDLFFAIDVGTGSVRSALVDVNGNVVAFQAKEHGQIVPRPGWAEQRPREWWEGVVETTRAVLQSVPGAADRIAATAACGQMHGTVLIDAAGDPVLDAVPLWNDKRTRDLVERVQRGHAAKDLLRITANPPTAAWQAFKLAWIKEHHPEAYRRATTLLMPKDYINFKLTGERAVDYPEASCSFLFSYRDNGWSQTLSDLLGLDYGLLPPLKLPAEFVGRVTRQAAGITGLREGTPVVTGVGDFPASLLGSGVIRPGTGSDSTGTSTLVTLCTERPTLDPTITNVLSVDGRNWNAFTILDAGGDAMRWARRAFHENAYSYDRIVELAQGAPAGSDHLVFLPYLNGERLGPHQNARAQFFGLTTGHGPGHLHRAVMEGVAFAARRNLRLMEAAGHRIDRLVASGGGAKTPLWLEIKASVYGCPIVVPKKAECGVVGCAMLAGLATGAFRDYEDAVARCVEFGPVIKPNPAWTPAYERLGKLFDDLHEASQGFYDRLEF